MRRLLGRIINSRIASNALGFLQFKSRANLTILGNNSKLRINHIYY